MRAAAESLSTTSRCYTSSDELRALGQHPPMLDMWVIFLDISPEGSGGS
jgi:hypothetical protein